MLEDLETLKLYKKYLNTIQPVIDGYFSEQKEYIKCHKGCSKCCEYGAYPFYKIEFDYIMTGFFNLERTIQADVIKRIKMLQKEYKNAKDKENFMYRCPFLTQDNNCSIYEQRGLICRTFGLIIRNIENKVTLPFCFRNGLNYADVYDPETKKIDYENVKEKGYKTLPKVYKASLGILTNPEIFGGEGFDFGEVKPLIEWLTEISQ